MRREDGGWGGNEGMGMGGMAIDRGVQSGKLKGPSV